MGVEKPQQGKWDTLTNEQVRQVEEVIILKPKSDWTFEELQLFNEWFYNHGCYFRGIIHLMKQHSFKIKGKLVVRFALKDEDAKDTVQDWIISFQTDLKFNPALGSSFISYYLAGLNQRALNRQRLCSEKNTDFIADKFNFNGDNYEDNGCDRIEDEKTLSAEEQVLLNEKRIILFSLINRLRKKPPIPKYERHAKVLELHLNGYSDSKIASFTGESEGNTRVLLSRAKAYITKDFEKLNEAEELHILKQTEPKVGGEKL